jgi:hypothetical protein
MPKSANQKLKILYLMDWLLRDTDEDHGLAMAEILARLEGEGIRAERKSIYDDLEALRQYGLDILTRKGKWKTRMKKNDWSNSRYIQIQEEKL